MKGENFMQMDYKDIEDTSQFDLLEENDIEVSSFIFDNFIVLKNYKMYSKADLKKRNIEFVDENYQLLTREDIEDFYNMLTDEDKKESYPRLNDFIEEGLSKNGTLERLKY
jgi:hypothetical protein